MSITKTTNDNQEDEPTSFNTSTTTTTETTTTNPNTNQEQQQQQQQQQSSTSSTSSKMKKSKAVVLQKFQSIVNCVQTRVKHRTTMEGMIRNSYRLLNDIIVVDNNNDSGPNNPPTKSKGLKQPTIPSQLFEKCHGIVFLSVVEVGMMLTGNIGTGIVLRKQPKELS